MAYAVMGEARIDAVALVDAWDIPDTHLNSELGRYVTHTSIPCV